MVNTNDAPGNAERWVHSHGITYPIVYDGEQEAARVYDVDSLPTLVVLDREGKVHAVRVGFTDQAEVERLVGEVL